MAFVLKQSDTYSWPVTFDVPVDGGRHVVGGGGEGAVVLHRLADRVGDRHPGRGDLRVVSAL